MRKIAEQFNLAQHVSKRVFFGAKLLTLALAIYFIVLIVVSAGLWAERSALQAKNIELSQQLKKADAALAPMLYKGEKNNKLIGVLPKNLQTDAGGFYQNFSDISKVSVPGLWLVQLSINRDGHQVAMAGATENKDNIKDFIDDLYDQNVFDQKQLEIAAMKKGLIDDLTKAQKEQVKELKLPPYYRFKITSKESGQEGKLS